MNYWINDVFDKLNNINCVKDNNEKYRIKIYIKKNLY